jgi:hypothetical protein
VEAARLQGRNESRLQAAVKGRARARVLSGWSWLATLAMNRGGGSP